MIQELICEIIHEDLLIVGVSYKNMASSDINPPTLVFHCVINPNSLDNKGSCWILKDFYCSVTMLRELGLMINLQNCIQTLRIHSQVELLSSDSSKFNFGNYFTLFLLK